MDRPDTDRRCWLICLVLVLGTLVIYGKVVAYDFTNYDDETYVTGNPHLQTGTLAGQLAWAFTSGYAGNWHPLTWISHLVDYRLYGLHPAGHHLTSILLHLANTLLLFGVLRRMTGATWRSATVAALFAWHPLHVESVAWVAERKDVLSAFFWLLTMWAYARYARRHGFNSFYYLALVFFALGLLAKPMVVTLPFVLLLMDWWPLRRFTIYELRFTSFNTKLLLEKLPFLALAALASLVTFLVQSRGGVMTLATLSFPQRVANVVVSYATYLRKTVWPDDLSVFYVLQFSRPPLTILCSAALLLAVTAVAVALRRRHPYLLVGWLWFLGTLVPVIGFVQVGIQSMADRYTYLPLIGVFIMAVWGAAELSERLPQRRIVLGAAAGVALAGCLVTASLQAGVWRNSVTLFEHALAVDPDNFVAHNNLGMALDNLGKSAEAQAHFEAALRVQPRSPMPLYNLGRCYEREGRMQDALKSYAASASSQPDYVPARYRLARLLAAQERLDEAATQYQECLRYSPDDADIHYNFANTLAAQGKLDEAAAHYRECLHLEPNSPEAHNNLGAVLMRLGNFNEAAGQFGAALRLRPNFPEAEYQLAAVFQKLGRTDDAKTHYDAAMHLKPDWPEPMRALATILATSAKPELRDGAEAVRLAERANELTGRRDPRILTVLDEAYAEAGRFDDAIKTAERVQELANSLKQPALAEKAAKRLELYRAGKAYHE